MNRKIFCFALGAMLFALCSSVEPQQPKKVPRIAYLAASPASANAGRLEFRDRAKQQKA